MSYWRLSEALEQQNRNFGGAAGHLQIAGRARNGWPRHGKLCMSSISLRSGRISTAIRLLLPAWS
jgi:hypothetical protein